MPFPVPQIDVDAIPDPPDHLFLLDVREQDEWIAGHIAGAHHIPMMDIPQRLADLQSDRCVVVVCRSGHRSAHVTAFLERQGTEAVNLDGGMQAWEAASRPMVSETDQPPAVL